MQINIVPADFNDCRIKNAPSLSPLSGAMVCQPCTGACHKDDPQWKAILQPFPATTPPLQLDPPLSFTTLYNQQNPIRVPVQVSRCSKPYARKKSP